MPHWRETSKNGGNPPKIKEAYNIDEFVKSPISNYKVLASIYKIFEYNGEL